jgi:MFS family permease
VIPQPDEDPETPEPSYRALFAIPRLGRILLSMQISRIATSMLSIALVLFVLAEYDSPALAGLVTFASIFPGLLVAPIAGALLDRHGRTRLIILDFLVALLALFLIGGLALADALPPALLVAITIVSSLTSILSHTGMRSLLPMIVPEYLWERVNAIDSNGYVVATILGPPIAATLVTVVGGPIALILIGATFGLAAVALIGAPDPPSLSDSTGRLLRDAWDGVKYTWANPTLRGLGFSISALNIAGGMITIVIPLIVLERLHAGEALVGLIFAISGVTGMVSAFWFGRQDTRGREWGLLVIPMLLVGPTLAILLVAAGAADPAVGFIAAALAMGGYGFLQGPADIALFTVRQRRTDVAWMGRAFAVSMAFNFLGYPTGAAIAGVLAATSIEASVIVGVAAALLAAGLAATMIPKQDDQAARSPVPTASG